jgi:hypothetical protein
MAKLKYDHAQPYGTGLGSAFRRHGVARLAGWVRRALGRDSGGGLLTPTPDGKLSCESLRAETERCD